MYEESIEALNEWFDDKDRSYDTGYNAYGEYSVSNLDMDDFCDYLREHETDLIGIPCMVGTGGIWFKREDLEKARYY